MAGETQTAQDWTTIPVREDVYLGQQFVGVVEREDIQTGIWRWEWWAGPFGVDHTGRERGRLPAIEALIGHVRSVRQ